MYFIIPGIKVIIAIIIPIFQIESENERYAMSDYIIKVIPIDPYYHINGQKINKIVDDLKTRITADNVELKTYDTPAFIVCGRSSELHH